MPLNIYNDNYQTLMKRVLLRHPTTQQESTTKRYLTENSGVNKELAPDKTSH